MNRITINDDEYPCRVTMGAMLRYKQETGRDVSRMKDDDVSDLVTFLWCCIASACACDGVSFGLGLMDFADRLDPDAVAGFYNGMKADSPLSPSGTGTDDPEKKTESQPAY